MSKSNWKLDPLLSESDRSGLVLPIAGQDIQRFHELTAAANATFLPSAIGIDSTKAATPVHGHVGKIHNFAEKVDALFSQGIRKMGTDSLALVNASLNIQDLNMDWTLAPFSMQNFKDTGSIIVVHKTHQFVAEHFVWPVPGAQATLTSISLAPLVVWLVSVDALKEYGSLKAFVEHKDSASVISKLPMVIVNQFQTVYVPFGLQPIVIGVSADPTSKIEVTYASFLNNFCWNEDMASAQSNMFYVSGL